MNRNADKKKFTLIIGMHRSGTSAIAAALKQVFRVHLSDREDIVEKDNPKGYFENFDIVQFNDRLLGNWGGCWDSIGTSRIIDFSDPAFEPRLNEAVEILRTHYGDDQTSGMKDPRISILLPFWNTALETWRAEVYRIIALRHPLEVAFSQQLRHRQAPADSILHLCGGDARYTLNLWYWYNIRLLNDLPDDKNLFVSFDRLLADTSHEIHRISRFIGCEADPQKQQRYENSFLEKQLKHHHVSEKDVQPYRDDYAYVFELYSRMKQHENEEFFSRKTALAILDGLPDNRFLQSWSSPFYGYVNTVKAKLTEFQTQTLALLQTEKQTIAELTAAITEKERCIAMKDEIIEKTDQSLADAVTLIAEKDKTIINKEEIIAEREQALTQVREDLEALRRKSNEKEQQIENCREELYNVYTSKSWRFALPLRKTGTLVRRLMDIPHKPVIRAKIKQCYFLLPAFIRHSRFIEKIKNRFKNKELHEKL